MRKVTTYITAFLMFFVAIPVLAQEEGESPEESKPAFVCRARVSYFWKRTDNNSSDTKNQGEQQVFASALVREGNEENKLRKELELALEISKRDALDTCKKEHENLSGCIASKFSMMASTLRDSSFEARGRIEKAVEEDCRVAFGTCTKVESTEIECEGQAVEEVEEESDKKGKGRKRG